MSHLPISNHDSTFFIFNPDGEITPFCSGPLLNSSFLKSVVIDVESPLNAGPYIPLFSLRLLHLHPPFPGSISNYSCCFYVVFRITSVLLCLRFGLESLLSLDVQQLDITISELRFLSFHSTGLADLALKGRILSRDPRPERHTIYSSLPRFATSLAINLPTCQYPSSSNLVPTCIACGAFPPYAPRFRDNQTPYPVQ